MFMNSDPRDDENEKKIKQVFLIPLAIMIVGFIILATFSGCSSNVMEPWNCECECKDTKFNCNGQTMKIEIKDEL